MFKNKCVYNNGLIDNPIKALMLMFIKIICPLIKIIQMRIGYYVDQIEMKLNFIDSYDVHKLKNVINVSQFRDNLRSLFKNAYIKTKY